MLASSQLNEAAALGTALMWSFSALAWSLSGRRIGSIPVAVIRVLLAAVIWIAIMWIGFGRLLPPMPAKSIIMLCASGVFGIFIGDFLFFRALVLIGPRLGMLISSCLQPIVTALIAMALGEWLSYWAILGIAVTIAGVLLVVSERRGQEAWPVTRRGLEVGVLLSVLSIIAAGFGYVLGRQGMLDAEKLVAPVELSMSAAMIRVVAACIVSWLSLPLIGRTKATMNGFRDRKAILIVIAGTIVGPVIGIWLLMVSLGGSAAGVTAALVSTSPIMLIPITFFAYRDRPTLRSVAGTCVAIAGVFVLMWK